jgi:uncharacterized membrane protein
MLATVLWIGGLAVLTLVVLPAARKVLDVAAYARFLDTMRLRLDPLGWLSALILLASGLIQMSARVHYEGFLTVEGIWAGAILVKHLLFGLMLTISGYITWGVLPALRRAALGQAGGNDASEMVILQQRSIRLMQVNLLIGVSVLLLSSIARSI